MRFQSTHRLPPLVVLVAALLAGCAQRSGTRSTPGTEFAPPEAYRRSVAALMWPGATRAFQVTPEGDLDNGAWKLHVSGVADGDSAGEPPVIAFEDRWCPVARWTRESGDVRWEFEAVALPDAEPGWFSKRGAVARAIAGVSRDEDRRRVVALAAGHSDSRLDSLLLRVRRPIERDSLDRRNLFVSLRVVVTNRGSSAHRVRGELRFAPRPRPATFSAPDSLVPVPWESVWAAAGESEQALGLGDGTIRGTALESDFGLAPGESRRLRVVLSAYPTPAEVLRRRARLPHETAVERVRRYWTAEVERGAGFDLPDSQVCEAVRAARVQLLSLRERRGPLWVPIGGPFHYRDVWLRDGARAIHALAVSGYPREARAMAEGFLEFQWPHGPFMSQRGQLDGTGQALWAFDQALLRPTPAPDVKRYADAALRAWRAIERQRARPAAPGAKPRLLPRSDPHDNEYVDAQLVGSDAWSIAGYRAAARLLRAAGRVAEADSVERARAEYVSTFDAALRASGRRDVPPSWQGEGNDFGNLAVGYPCAVLPASDTRLAELARRYWAPVGGAGLGYARNPDSLHSYVGADLGTWALLVGRRASADSVLDATIAWRSASGGAAEVCPRSTRDFGVNFPPHPTAAAAILVLVRNALVYDDGDTLMLTLGARESWWRGARVRRAPTRWGLLDLSFRRRGRLAEWTWSPMPVWTVLALPPGTALAGSLPQGLERGPRPDLMLAPPGTRAAKIEIVDARPTRSPSTTVAAHR